MSWQIFIGFSIVTYSFAVLVQRLILRTDSVHPIAFSIVGQLLSALLTIIIGLTFGQLGWPNWQPVFWNLVFMTLMYSLGSVVTNIALKLTEASKFTILFSTRAFLTILIASFLMGESLTPWQLAGAGLIFVGVVLASWQAKKFVLEKGDWLTLLGALIFGAVNVNDRFILQQMPVFTYNALAFLLPPLVIMMVYPNQIQYIPDFFKKGLLAKTLLLSSLYFVSALSFFRALQVSTNTSQVVSVNLISVVLIVILSILLLKERSHLWLKLAGAGVCLAGLLLVT